MPGQVGATSRYPGTMPRPAHYETPTGRIE
jgi:hypothetical protein